MEDVVPRRTRHPLFQLPTRAPGTSCALSCGDVSNEPEDGPKPMAITNDTNRAARDPKALKIVAKSIYRELVDGGFGDQDVIALAGELLSLVTSGVKARRGENS